MISSVCRVCLSYTNHTKNISNTPLQYLYEKITNNQLVLEDGRPESVCIFCYSLLQRCCKFVNTSKKSEEFLSLILQNGIELTEKILLQRDEENPVPPPFNLSISNVSHVTLPENNPDIKHLIKKEPLEYYVVIDPNRNEELNEEYNKKMSKEAKDNSSEESDESLESKACEVKEILRVEFEKPNPKKICRPVDKKNPTQVMKIEENLVPSKPLHINLEKNDTTDSKTKLYCQFCLKNFRSKQYFKRHMRIHTGEKPYKCKTCKETFRDSVLLKQHVKSHSGEIYTCEVCAKVFTVLTRLKEHQIIHSGEKPHACDKCHFTFSHKNSLIRHLRIHSGEKPFMCQICSKQFRQTSNLIKHEAVCKTGKRTRQFFKCVCSKTLRTE